MADRGRVEIDTAELERYAARLADNLTAHGPDLARRHAERVAQQIRGNVPRRSGRLAASVKVNNERDGSAVEYGGGVPYATYIEHRTSTVADATDDAAEPFYRDAVQLAESEARHA